jgi:hypothetical protein
MIQRMGVVAAAVLMCGCATGYHEFSAPLIGLKGGYTDKQVGPGELIKVSFEGNGWTKEASVQDYLLLRSAEVAKLHGKPYFCVYGSIAEAILGRSSKDAHAGSVMATTYGFVYILLEDEPVPGSLGTADLLAKYAYLSSERKGGAE